MELMARKSSKTPSTAFSLPTPRGGERDCDFSFSGIHVAADRLIAELESSCGECFIHVLQEVGVKTPLTGPLPVNHCS